MGQMTTPKELFVHALKDVYYAEKVLTRTLPQLANEAGDKELTKAFQTHLDETRKQVENLEQVFRNMGRGAEAQPCPGIEGIKKEHDEFMQENPMSPPIVRDVFLTNAASRAEHYEIAAYTGLIEQARALGERDSVKLLQENLRQEKDALKKVESISKRLLKSTNGGRGSRSRSTASRSSTSKRGTTKRATAGRRTTSTSRARQRSSR
jgi:ferritin-like metal-binding protein YciE